MSSTTVIKLLKTPEYDEDEYPQMMEEGAEKLRGLKMHRYVLTFLRVLWLGSRVLRQRRRVQSAPEPVVVVAGASGDDRARREVEKRRIREEMIAREIMWRRELEEEVRQELALEHELALRRRSAEAPHLRDSLFREQLLELQRAGVERGLFWWSRSRSLRLGGVRLFQTYSM